MEYLSEDLRHHPGKGLAPGIVNPTHSENEENNMAKILIIDDSPADIRFMTEALRPTGHTVVSITDSSKAEATMESERPDLTLLDVVMPERNGYETLRALKKLPAYASTKVVFVSSKGSDTDVKWGLRQGAVDYLVKPYTPEQVVTLVGRHV